VLVLAPLSLKLWLDSSGSLRFALIAWLIPILYAYIVPGIGTNVLELWEFDVRFRLGRFRPHHGLVFGSAASLLAWVSVPDEWLSPVSLGGALRTAFSLASVLGFWNILYDIAAMRCGLLRVYNQAWAEGKEAEIIVMDYAPWVFGGFGFVYGLVLGTSELFLSGGSVAHGTFLALLFALSVASIAFPVVGYALSSKRRHGHFGLKSYRASE
jgi:hypothetical protein